MHARAWRPHPRTDIRDATWHDMSSTPPKPNCLSTPGQAESRGSAIVGGEGTMSSDTAAYIAQYGSQLQDAVTRALAQVLNEQAPDPSRRAAELLMGAKSESASARAVGLRSPGADASGTTVLM